MTTDQPTYQVGAAVQISFVLTNTGDQPVTFTVPSYYFIVEPANESSTYLNWPGDPDQLPVVTLQPGQSYSVFATWDSTPPANPVSATDSVLVFLDDGGPVESTTFQLVGLTVAQPVSAGPVPTPVASGSPTPVASGNPTPTAASTPHANSAATPTPSPTPTPVLSTVATAQAAPPAIQGITAPG